MSKDNKDTSKDKDPEVGATPQATPDNTMATGAEPVNPGASVIWDDANMTETYANVSTILATQEEFSILFGTQTGLRPDPAGMRVQVSNRVMINPFLAKRLLGILTRTVNEYERRFGEIKAD